jgi:hypothetical protein
MAKIDYLIPIGIFKKTKKVLLGHYSFKKMLGEVLNWLNVPFADPCCAGMADSVPVRYNPSLNRLEVFHVTLGEWVDINTIDIVTTSTTTTTTAA